MKRKDVFLVIFFIGLLLIPFTLKNMSVFQNKDYQTGERGYKGFDNYIFPYQLSYPSKKLKLPHCLDEISGLSYLEQNKLVCIQDEKGMMYVVDLEKGKVTEKLKFGEGRDYEDIVIVNKNAYVLQSNGNIFKVKNFDSHLPKVKKYNTLLSKENDAEGLAFDEESNTLLIACKDSPHLKKKCNELKGKRAVYRFDLYTNEIFEKPACVIDIDDLRDFGRCPLLQKSFMGNIKIFDLSKGDINFRPSGIAIHPKTKNIYIISSADRMLIVLNQKGDILTAKGLNKKIFKQPEGICFSPEGDLFISNEKNGRKANILMFNPTMTFKKHALGNTEVMHSSLTMEFPKKRDKDIHGPN
ncbi:MAG: SdiA-regulated domain-containing protein [bacterium]